MREGAGVAPLALPPLLEEPAQDCLVAALPSTSFASGAVLGLASSPEVLINVQASPPTHNH